MIALIAFIWQCIRLIQADEARIRIRELDPSMRLIKLSHHFGLPPSSPQCHETIIQPAANLYQSIFMPLSENVAMPSDFNRFLAGIDFDQQPLDENLIRTVLFASMRHNDIDLFKVVIRLAGEALQPFNGDANELEYFIFELTAPLTPKIFLDEVLKTTKCNFAEMIVPRLNALNQGHKTVLREYCNFAVRDDLVPKGYTDPFQKIKFNSMTRRAKDSIIRRQSTDNHVIIYSIASEAKVTIEFPKTSNAMDIFNQCKKVLRQDPSIKLTAFVYDKSNRKGHIIKTRENEGPHFLILECKEDESLPIPEMVTLVNSEADLTMIEFDVKESQMFLGFPKDFNEVFENKLFIDAPGWYSELPADTEEVEWPFQRLFEYRRINIGTEMVFSLLKDVITTSYWPRDPAWTSSEEEDVSIRYYTNVLPEDEVFLGLPRYHYTAMFLYLSIFILVVFYNQSI
jgi:hypothetical protein